MRHSAEGTDCSITIKMLFIQENYDISLPPIKNFHITLASMAQLVGYHPAMQKFAGSIPGQGMCLGCGPGLWLGAYWRQLIDVSLTHQCFSLFLPPFPFSENKHKSLKKPKRILSPAEGTVTTSVYLGEMC